MQLIVLKKLSILTLKYAGFGLLATGIEDEILDSSQEPYNLIIIIAGALAWLTGCYLDTITQEKKSNCNSTSLIQTSLRYAAGTAFSNGVTHLIKQKYTTSANVSNIASSLLIYPAAIEELEKATLTELPQIKWEKLRFLILFIGDYFTASGSKPMMNGDHIKLYNIIALPLGLFLSISESVYSYKYDAGLNVKSLLNRRGIKLSIGIGSVFILKNMIFGVNTNYSNVDNSFAILCNFLLFATLVELRRLSKKEEKLMITSEPLDTSESNYKEITTMPSPV